MWVILEREVVCLIARVAEIIVLLRLELLLRLLSILLLGLGRTCCRGCIRSFYSPGVQVGNIPYLTVTFPAITPYVKIHFHHLTFLELVDHGAALVYQLKRGVIGKHHTGRAFISEFEYEFSF